MELPLRLTNDYGEMPPLTFVLEVSLR